MTILACEKSSRTLSLGKVLFLLALLVASVNAGDKKCRALAMSGGGDKGAYQASVFIEFVNALGEEASYDVVTGASAGSLNGAGLSLFAPGDEDEASLFIYGLWNSITASDILEQWDEGILAGLTVKPGLFNNQPLVDFLYEQIGSRTIQKRFSVVITNADEGTSETVDFSASDVMPDDTIPTIVASSALPFAFPHLTKNNTTYIDGGCIWNLEVAGAVRRCREIVDNDEDIIVDIILCSEAHLPNATDFSKYTPLNHYLRAQQIQEWVDTMQDIERSLSLFPDVNFRYVLGPSETLSNSPIPLDFSKDHLDYCFEIGKKDAHKALELGEGVYRDLLLDYFNRKQNGEKELVFSEMLNAKISEKRGDDPFKFESK